MKTGGQNIDTGAAQAAPGNESGRQEKKRARNLRIDRPVNPDRVLRS